MIAKNDYYWDRKDRRIEYAIDAALAAQRPLLVRGEPGIGKSCIAKAATDRGEKKRLYIEEEVTSKTEPNDLLWRYDSVKRLAQAQIMRHPGYGKGKTVDQKLAESRFVSPGPLWWAFNAEDAKRQHGKCSSLCFPLSPNSENSKRDLANGWVVLIDEIDKADSDVPNALLGAFADREFTPQFCKKVVLTGTTPLIVITTNEERELPAAFLRRCLVLELKFPENDQVAWLVNRARKHVGGLDDSIMKEAAEELLKARKASAFRHKPSLAEYIDLLKAIAGLVSQEKSAATLLQDIKPFFLNKNSQ